MKTEHLLYALDDTDLRAALGLMPVFFRRYRPAEVRASLFHDIAYLSVFALIQPETSIVRACFDLQVVAAVAEPNHRFSAVRALMIDSVFAVLPLALDHIVAGSVVFQCFQCVRREPHAIASWAL